MAKQTKCAIVIAHKHNWVKGTHLPTNKNAHNERVVVLKGKIKCTTYWWAVKPGMWWAEVNDYEKIYKLVKTNNQQQEAI